MMEEQLTRGFAALQIPVEGIPALCRYADLLAEKNKVMNLTAITDPEEIASLHFLDSLCLLNILDFSAKRVIDVGTGAGFPGLPLRIVQPDVQLTLLDALNKRVDFLREVCGALNLPDVFCVHARAEEFGHREEYDIAVSRAVASLPLLLELCLPFVKVGGRFLAMKGRDSDEEIAAAAHAAELLGAGSAQITDYPIPGTDVVHRAVLFEKIRPTPVKYPRAFAKIKNSPL